jgi:hypothetical protein
MSATPLNLVLHSRQPFSIRLGGIPNLLHPFQGLLCRRSQILNLKLGELPSHIIVPLEVHCTLKDPSSAHELRLESHRDLLLKARVYPVPFPVGTCRRGN